jgi:hypothetical protein
MREVEVELKCTYYENLAKKLVCFFAWAIEKEAEQIPFASFRFKANFFCKTGRLLSWILALMKKVSEVDEKPFMSSFNTFPLAYCTVERCGAGGV